MALRVADFGPLGTADDAGTFNAAIAAAMAEPNGCRVEMPAGDFNIATQVVLPKTAGKCVKLLGEGKKASVFRMAPSMSVAGLYVGSGVAAGGCDLRCEGFGVVGGPTQKGMALDNANGFVGRELSFSGLLIGIQPENSYWLDLAESEFLSIALYGFVSTTGAHGLRLHRLGFYNMAAQSILMAGSVPTYNMAVTACDFETVGSCFQTVPGVSGFAFERNYVEFAAHALMALGNNSGAVSIRSNELQASADTTIAASDLDFSYNDLWGQQVTLSAMNKQAAGNKLRGESAIL